MPSGVFNAFQKLFRMREFQIVTQSIKQFQCDFNHSNNYIHNSFNAQNEKKKRTNRTQRENEEREKKRKKY